MNVIRTPVAVTGSTGALGGAVAASLAAAGASQRLLVRNAGRAPSHPGADVAQCSYSDATAAVQALAGIEVLFMVSASESADRVDQQRTFVDSAVAAGVRHIVYTSFVGAAPDAVFTLARDHHATESHIRSTGIGFTFLRDNFYLDVMEHFVGEDGVLRGPAGEGRAALVARVDVARTAAAVLSDPARHLGRTYDLTGPEALSMTEVAATLSDVRGVDVRFHDETVAEAYESRARWAAPAWQNDAWVSTYTAIASGALADVSGDVEEITGRRPLSFREFLTVG
ncbi:SDR family oxidoreductase [Rhodococcus sp. UNC23MFCrub1.1]|uniref:SDR family oxidoreductase n=1 Tax=Rhodococcus sp. UNC23MFCrub1.1 TaxID=1449068 RepID=UPI00055A4CFD|nr:SDR family oxidoreductase [Rhodococcus sp. UNC23MFCrub1.1]